MSGFLNIAVVRTRRFAALGTTACSALLAGLALAAATTPAAATPTFGAFATVSGRGTDGGWGDVDASRSGAWTGGQTGYSVMAQANLATGSLHAASTARQECGAQGCGWGWGVGAEARLFDRYTFTNTGENLALIPVSLRIDGQCAGDAVNRAQYRFAFSAHPINIETVPYHSLPCDGTVDVVAPINLVSWVGQSSWYAFVEISTGVRFPDFDDESSFGLVDFGHTLKIDIVLPEGVTMSSDSGVFPSRRETAVPEPMTLATLGAGLAVFGVMRRGRRRA